MVREGTLEVMPLKKVLKVVKVSEVLKRDADTLDTSDTFPRGFTLVELLVVIVIIVILTSIGLVIFRDVSARARDGSRIADLDSLKSAIQIATHDEPDMAQALCFGIAPPCTESSYPQDTNTKKTDGTGWIKINFDVRNVVNFSVLPVDPLNNAQYYFTYKSDGSTWKLEAILESNDYKKLMLEDGGNKDDRFEIGTNIKTL